MRKTFARGAAIVLALAAATFVAGCAAPVRIIEGAVVDRAYKELGTVDVTLTRAAGATANPTKEQANAALAEKARKLGADAVIDVTYETGEGLGRSDQISASGTAVQFTK